MRFQTVFLFVLLPLIGCSNASEDTAPARTRDTAVESKASAQKTRRSAEPVTAKKNVANISESMDAVSEKAETPKTDLLSELRASPVVFARLISGRTLSLKLRLEGDLKAVFKPVRRGDWRAGREVAVFRLARLLGVERVPTSTIREIPLHSLVRFIRNRNPEEATALEQTAYTDNKGLTRGAVIQWIDDLSPNHLETLGGIRAIKKCLAPARIKEDCPPIAANVSAMIVFDYVTGNWDRFSGGNIFVAANHSNLVLLDHNGTFAPWSDRQKKRMQKLLKETARFPVGLIRKLRALEAKDIEGALSEEPWHSRRRLVSLDEVGLLLSRKDTLLNHVDELIRLYGEEAVLAFP
ncbi:MAG: hypothetical protein GY847_04490 [Proteobacteria bacterium]|nr:hypothetical protein [Pseudomonadota bacterium]